MAEEVSFCRKGRSFDWFFDISSKAYCYQSSKFEIVSTNSKWILCFSTNSTSDEYQLTLIKLIGNASYKYRVTIVTFIDIAEFVTRSETTISAPYNKGHDISFVKKFSLTNYIKITCTFYPHQDVTKNDKSTQLSVECFEYQVKRKCIEDDSSIKPFASFLASFKHLENLSENFNNMLQKGILTDIELKCGEVSIPAHKAVLMSRSEVFSAMFEHETVEITTSSIYIDDIAIPVLQEFLKYLYSGKISEELSAEDVSGLYKASDKYAVQSLQEGCRDIFLRNLTEENCIEILMLGEKYSDQKLKDIITDFIIERPAVLTSEAWIEFEDKFLKLANTIYKKILCKDNLNKLV